MTSRCMRTLEPEGVEEKPMGSGMPGTLDLAPGGERSCATQVGTSEFDVDIVMTVEEVKSARDGAESRGECWIEVGRRSDGDACFNVR